MWSSVVGKAAGGCGLSAAEQCQQTFCEAGAPVLKAMRRCVFPVADGVAFGRQDIAQVACGIADAGLAVVTKFEQASLQVQAQRQAWRVGKALRQSLGRA